MKKYVSLTFKITIFSTAIILLTSMCVVAIVYWITSDFFLESAIKNVDNETRLIANDIENSLIKINNDIQVLAKTPPIQGIIRSTNNKGADEAGSSNFSMWKERLITIFESMLAANKNYTQIRYIGVADDGKEIVRVNQTPTGIYNTADAALQSKANAQYYKEGVQLSRGSIMFSSINYNQEKGKVEYPLVVTLRVVTPVYSQQQKLFGLLVININISRYLRDILLRSAGKYNVLLYDQYNDFFVFNNQHKTLEFLPRDDKVKKDLFGNKEVLSTDQIVPFLKHDTKRISIFKPIYSNYYKDQKVLTVVISIPKHILSVENFSLIYQILFGVIAICLCAALLVFLFARKAMRPLSDLATTIAAAPRLSGKGLNLPTQLNDEVGLLANAFNDKTKLLNQLALFDSLTGLPNRKNFIDHLDDALQRAASQSRIVAIAYIDINNFKEVNDTYGHDYGDLLLMQFSSALKDMIREHDFCARLGGDEFALILEGLDVKNKLDSLLKRYEEGLNKSYDVNGVALHMLISGGVAIYPDDGLKSAELLRKADQAMYRSKKEGTGQFSKPPQD